MPIDVESARLLFQVVYACYERRSMIFTTNIEFSPARVLFQDFTGVPVFVDSAVMREACANLGGDPAKDVYKRQPLVQRLSTNGTAA